MRINSYTIVHYAKDYLEYSLRSIQPYVDRSFCFYTPHPSHGHSSFLPPIESREEIISSIPNDLWTNKLTWIDTDSFWQEGQQRDYALNIASENASLVLVCDYDEVWPAQTLQNVLEYIYNVNSARTWLLNFAAHFWRSFSWACTDENWPVRVIDTRHKDGLAYIPKELGDVYHFGYAIRDETLRYKLSCHGHKDEIRKGWYEEKWQAWPPVEDCHPTNGRKQNGEGWWNPKPFDKYLLPEIMRNHKWFNTERID